MQLTDIQKFINSHNLFVNEKIVDLIPVKNSYSNDVYKVVTNTHTYYLRCARINNHINRYDEQLVLAKLGVTTYFYDDLGNQVRDWFPGIAVKQWDNCLLNALILKVESIHAITGIKIAEFNHYKYDTYFRGSAYFEKYGSMYYDLVDKYKDFPQVVCHNDLNPTNILMQDKTIHIIDFEYVKLNTKYWEYANFARENLDYEQIVYLCSTVNLDLNTFIEFLIMTCIHALQWSLTIPKSPMIQEYIKNTQDRLEYFIALDN